MSIKQKIIAIRDNYVINQVQKLHIPEFSQTPVCRYRVRFSGRVQHVGFRLEVCELAKRLALTGFCQNLENGDVLAEFQGTEQRIQFLITFMESLKRIKITNKTLTLLEVIESEKGFTKR